MLQSSSWASTIFGTSPLPRWHGKDGAEAGDLSGERPIHLRHPGGRFSLEYGAKDRGRTEEGGVGPEGHALVLRPPQAGAEPRRAHSPGRGADPHGRGLPGAGLAGGRVLPSESGQGARKHGAEQDGRSERGQGDGEGDGIGCGGLGRPGYEVQLGSAFSAGISWHERSFFNIRTSILRKLQDYPDNAFHTH